VLQANLKGLMTIGSAVIQTVKVFFVAVFWKLFNSVLPITDYTYFLAIIETVQ
jgi:hypothetical protein